jgi:hypothetical protein
MAKPANIYEIKITGELQAAIIKEAFKAKEESKKAEDIYKQVKEQAIGLIKNKIYDSWIKESEPRFGQYAFKLPDGTTHTITAQDQSTRKNFTPHEAKAIIAEIGCKGSDILEIVTKHEINEKITKKPKIFNQVKAALEELQTKLHASGELAPEETLIETTRDLYIVEHAIPRLMATSESREQFSESLTKLKDPVTCLLIS